MFPPPLPHHFKYWVKHTAAVPKGFLRYYVLRLLEEKPMSGSEIMDEIEKQSKGFWKPSPGSIYPLIAWLQEKGYISEVPEKEAGVKRYSLTPYGKTLLEEQLRMRQEFRKRFRFFAPPFFGLIYPEKAHEVREASRKLATAVWDLWDSMQEKYSEEAVAEAKVALEQAAQKIDEIIKKLKAK